MTFQNEIEQAKRIYAEHKRGIDYGILTSTSLQTRMRFIFYRDCAEGKYDGVVMNAPAKVSDSAIAQVLENAAMSVLSVPVC